jgi:hypothetical protein
MVTTVAGTHIRTHMAKTHAPVHILTHVRAVMPTLRAHTRIHNQACTAGLPPRIPRFTHRSCTPRQVPRLHRSPPPAPLPRTPRTAHQPQAARGAWAAYRAQLTGCVVWVCTRRLRLRAPRAAQLVRTASGAVEAEEVGVEAISVNASVIWIANAPVGTLRVLRRRLCRHRPRRVLVLAWARTLARARAGGNNARSS